MKTLVSLLVAFATTGALAFPVAPFNALERSPSKALAAVDTDYDFEGIVKLSNCSGSLVAFSGQPLASKAIVMTNGHCLSLPGGGFLQPGQSIVNSPVSRSMRIYDKNMRLTTVQATKILYATMTGTDLAFYELSETYNQILAKAKIRPLLLDAVRPLAGIQIDIVSGYWDRGYSCDVDGFVFKIRESSWTFTDSIRYTAGCDTIGGTSGSPIIARGERRVIGINNTSNESGGRCTMNNPCEVDEANQVTVRRGARYGQQTYQAYTCLTPDFQIDVNRSGCELHH